MPDNLDETEYEVDTLSTTIFRKPRGHRLNPSDAKKSIYRAGTAEPNAEWDEGRSWNGQV
jgi:hypothetical protein